MKEQTICLFENGRSGFQLLLPAEPTARERFACEEFLSLFEQGSGIRLTVTDEYREDGTYISIGHTALYRRNEALFDAADRDALLVRFIEGQYHAGLDYEARQNADLACSRYRYALTHCDMLGDRRERERLADLIEKAEYRLFREHPELEDTE